MSFLFNIKKRIINKGEREHYSLLRRAFQFVWGSRISRICLYIITIVIILSLFGPLLSHYDYTTTNMKEANLSPCVNHLFGTDALGRDLWSRVWIGVRVSLFIGFIGAVCSQLIGCFVGCIAGYVGGWVDLSIMGVTDIAVCIPSLVYLTLLSLWIGPGVFSVLVAISISNWMESARLVRSRIMQYKSREFVLIARSQGATAMYIIIKHILPNIIGSLVISLFSLFPSAIFSEAYLSFIGLGIASPLTSLGQLCKTGVGVFRMFPYQLLFPGIIISILILALFVLGNSFRDAFDPFNLQE